MSEEEKEAIERIKYNDIAKPLSCGDLTICNIEDLRIVLNLIEKKDKIIDEMAKYIDFDKMNFQCSTLCVKENCQKECIKQYFEKKVERSESSK